ncbi:hypothetical protein BRADI_5g02083v3 [Brachypodium distachyon]|uniref:Uncharacterized protein n=1 Tax=Brachypodium distachyon TaxID=15368 RepID=A0A2K2CF03_BRADI|nr:hypothetical protein BRADI_5g02083v3 [Brachypodium distachyon]
MGHAIAGTPSACEERARAEEVELPNCSGGSEPRRSGGAAGHADSRRTVRRRRDRRVGDGAAPWQRERERKNGGERWRRREAGRGGGSEGGAVGSRAAMGTHGWFGDFNGWTRGYENTLKCEDSFA